MYKSIDRQCIGVIDDKKELQLRIEKIFRESNYQIQNINSFKEAFNSIKANKNNLYLIDYSFQNYSALDLLTEVRKENESPPIILFCNKKKDHISSDSNGIKSFDLIITDEIDDFNLRNLVSYRLKEFRYFQELQNSEAKYRNLLESMPLMFFLVNPNPPYSPVYISKSFETLGYPLNDWFENPSKWREILHPDDAEEVLAETDIAKENSKETNLEYRVIDSKGDIRWLKDRGHFVKNKKGEIVYWQGYIADITEKKQTEIALQESEKQYRNLIENAHDIIYSHDLKGNLKNVNRAVERIIGYSVEEALKRNIKDFVVPEHQKRFTNEILRQLSEKASSPFKIDILNKEHNKVSLEVSSRLIYKDNKPFRVEGIARDISERNRLSEELDRFYNLSTDMLATIDFKGNILQVNPTWKRVLGYRSEEVLNQSIMNFIYPDDIDKSIEYGKKIRKGESVSFEVRMLCKDKGYRWVEWGSNPVLEDKIYYSVARDITKRKESEKKLEYTGLHDSLTGLPNRQHFMRHLSLAIERANIDSKFRFAVLFIDLDRFKIVNDSLGHIVGDKLLIEVAETLRNCVRTSDVIARLGGDEFTVLLTLKENNEVKMIADRIQENLSFPFKIDGFEVFISASVGISLSNQNKRNPEEFLRDADLAMYHAKKAGKARYEIYDKKLHAKNLNQLQIESDLRHAIDEKQFKVFYQPIVNLDTGKISEFEALIRWQHPERGLIFPDQFIGIAEETGLIIPIGTWVIEESCRQILEWEKKLSLPLRVSVNLSAKQLMSPLLVGRIEKIISDLNIKPEKIKLEVTETTVMENTEIALKTLNDLNQIGIKLSTDDFGTGYSSLSYLHLFPFERIKIDRSFVGKMDTDVKREGIVRSIMVLGNNLEIDIVAEGIENADQLWQLRSLGCRLGQGYFFSKAVEPFEAERLLKDGLEINFDEMEVPFSLSADFLYQGAINTKSH